jgi:hypothetical protein
MKFEVVSSSLDGEFDPLAQYFWNVSNGLSPRFGDYDQKENQRRNEALIATIAEIADSISSGAGPVELDLASCANYTAESSVALCTLIDTLIEHESSVQDSWDDEDVDSYEALGALVDLLAQPQCPRPVLWHLINKVSTFGTNWVCDDQKTPYLLYALGRNPVIGDQGFMAHLNKYQSVSGEELVGTSTAYDAFKNPSLTIASLEKLYCDYWYDFDPDWAEIHTAGASYQHPLRFKPRTQVGESGESSPSGRIFALILARVFDELKLERSTWEELRTSGNKYFRTIAFYWPKTPVNAKSQLLKAGVIELNAEAEEFVNYSFAHPYMSALSPALAQKPLP